MAKDDFELTVQSRLALNYWSSCQVLGLRACKTVSGKHVS